MTKQQYPDFCEYMVKLGYTRNSAERQGEKERWYKTLRKVKIHEADETCIVILVRFIVWSFEQYADRDAVLARDPIHVELGYMVIDQYQSTELNLNHAMSYSPVFYQQDTSLGMAVPKDFTFEEVEKMCKIIEEGCMEFTEFYIRNIRQMILKSQNIKRCKV